MLIGSSFTPFYQAEPTSYTTLAPTLTPYGGTTGSLTGGGGYFTGYGSSMPYSPTAPAPASPLSSFYAQNFSNVALGGMFSPNANVPNYPIADASRGAASVRTTAPATQQKPATTASTPVTTSGSDKVVYAHYAPTTAPKATATGGGKKKAAEAKKTTADAKADDAKKADPKKADDKKSEPKKGSTTTVKSGDTLSKIAAAHGTTWKKLYELNKGAIGSNPNLIHPGLKLKLP